MTPQNPSVSSMCPKKGTIHPSTLVDQRGLLHTRNSSAEQQRKMFVSSEHIKMFKIKKEIEIMSISFSLKIRTFL